MTPTDRAKLDQLLADIAQPRSWTIARENAGLSLGQAAKVTGIAVERLRGIEAVASATRSETAALLAAYDVDAPPAGHVYAGEEPWRAAMAARLAEPPDALGHYPVRIKPETEPFETCVRCLRIRPRDGYTSACPGPARLELRGAS